LHQSTFTLHNHGITLPNAHTPTLRNHERLNGHAHSGFAGHSHGLATHKHFHEQDPGWLSFVLRSPEPQQVESLKLALIEVAKAEPLLRTKGFIQTDNPELTTLVQGVRTRVTMTSSCQPSSRKSELVFIGYHLNRNTVAARLSEMTGTEWK
jgi:cobalamin biosynthesis protein CobW